MFTISIYGENNIDEIDEADALANGEAKYQIREGNLYEYEISNGYFLECPEIITRSKIKDADLPVGFHQIFMQAHLQ